MSEEDEVIATMDAVWPPPPMRPPEPAAYPLRVLLRTAGGCVSDLRSGTLRLTPQGIVIEGRQAALSAEQQAPWILLGVLGFYFGALFVALVLDYIRRPVSVLIPWEEVDRVLLPRRSGEVGISFYAENAHGRRKRFSLAFTLPSALRREFEASAREHLGERVLTGRLHEWHQPVLLAVLSPLLLLGLMCAVGVLLSFFHG